MSAQNLSPQQFGVKVMPKEMYVNVAMQMTPPSEASNTVGSAKA
jgi:uncharacterized surface protein with fasciclin (FAS1) repeats